MVKDGDLLVVQTYRMNMISLDVGYPSSFPRQTSFAHLFCRISTVERRNVLKILTGCR